MIGIYAIRNLKNNKIYIGQSTNIERRFREHKNRGFFTEYETPIYKAFRKYGLENFSFEVLEEAEQSKLNEKEIFYIKIYRSNEKKFGYNLTDGGTGYRGKFAEEHKQKMSLAKKGEKNPMYKKEVSEETRLKRSLSLKGLKKPESFKIAMSKIHKGKKLSLETKEKLRNANLGRKLTEEQKNKLSKSSLGKKHTEETKEILKKLKSKKVIKKDLQNNILEVYESAKDAQIYTGVNKTNISACCNGRRKNAGGFIWSFEN